MIKLGRQVKTAAAPVCLENPDGMNESPCSDNEFDNLHNDSLNCHLVGINDVKLVNNVWFKSKVVSRSHAEMWWRDGQLYLRDTGSSSGTFLNRLRLSPSGKGSRPYPLKDSDIIQLGIDYQGRQEDIYKCVMMKIAIKSMYDQNSEMLKRENPIRFRNALKSLLSAANPFSSLEKERQTETTSTSQPHSTPPHHQNRSHVDCCICLCGIGPFQALFISPCSHCFHYKCIRNLLNEGYMFQCPVCRQVANLDASVSMESLCDLQEDEILDETNITTTEQSQKQGLLSQDGKFGEDSYSNGGNMKFKEGDGGSGVSEGNQFGTYRFRSVFSESRIEETRKKREEGTDIEDDNYDVEIGIGNSNP